MDNLTPIDPNINALALAFNIDKERIKNVYEGRVKHWTSFFDRWTSYDTGNEEEEYSVNDPNDWLVKGSEEAKSDDDDVVDDIEEDDIEEDTDTVSELEFNQLKEAVRSVQDTIFIQAVENLTCPRCQKKTDFLSDEAACTECVIIDSGHENCEVPSCSICQQVAELIQERLEISKKIIDGTLPVSEVSSENDTNRSSSERTYDQDEDDESSFFEQSCPSPAYKIPSDLSSNDSTISVFSHFVKKDEERISDAGSIQGNLFANQDEELEPFVNDKLESNSCLKCNRTTDTNVCSICIDCVISDSGHENCEVPFCATCKQLAELLQETLAISRKINDGSSASSEESSKIELEPNPGYDTSTVVNEATRMPKKSKIDFDGDNSFSSCFSQPPAKKRFVLQSKKRCPSQKSSESLCEKSKSGYDSSVSDGSIQGCLFTSSDEEILPKMCYSPRPLKRSKKVKQTWASSSQSAKCQICSSEITFESKRGELDLFCSDCLIAESGHADCENMSCSVCIQIAEIINERHRNSSSAYSKLFEKPRQENSCGIMDQNSNNLTSEHSSIETTEKSENNENCHNCQADKHKATDDNYCDFCMTTANTEEKMETCLKVPKFKMMTPVKKPKLKSLVKEDNNMLFRAADFSVVSNNSRVNWAPTKKRFSLCTKTN